MMMLARRLVVADGEGPARFIRPEDDVDQAASRLRISSESPLLFLSLPLLVWLLFLLTLLLILLLFLLTSLLVLLFFRKTRWSS